MEAFTTHTGKVATLNRANVDTDQIIPKQFLKSIRRTGFGPQLFFDWRYLSSGDPDPDFELNQSRFEGASLLVTRNNFGCGSSREHAVWAILQDGYRAVIAPSKGEGDQAIPAFADIFKNNAVKNGLLTVELSEEQVDQIFDRANSSEGLVATVDLAKQEIRLHGGEAESCLAFEIDATSKEQLMRGLDEIALTLEHQNSIQQFEAVHDPQLASLSASSSSEASVK